MARPLPDLSLTDWAVLGVITEGRTHGFSVAKQFTRDGSAGRVWIVPRPLVYRAIDALVALGLVQRVGSTPGDGGPRRTLLEATPDGSELLAEWLDEPIEHVRDARSQLLMKLLLSDRRGLSTTALVERQRERLVEMAHGLESQLKRADGFDAVLVRWRLYSVQTLDRFLLEI